MLTSLVASGMIAVGVAACTGGSGAQGAGAAGDAVNRSVEFLGAGNHATEGTLLLPPGAQDGKPVPAVLIVPDEGLVNRDGTTPIVGTPDRLYSDLAQNLEQIGIASLRYDPRGAIYSSGQTSLANGQTLSYEDLVGDAQAGLKFLQSQRSVKSADIALLGDGVGGLVSLSAVKAGSMPRALVLVSTPGRPVIDSMTAQVLADAPTPDAGQAAVAQLQNAAALLAMGSPLPDPGQGANDLKLVLTNDRSSYLKTLFSLDPAALAGQAHLPTLIVQGGKDATLTAADTQALSSAIGSQATVLTPAEDTSTLTVVVPPDTSGGTTTSLLGMQEFMTTTGTPVVRDGATFGTMMTWITANLR